MTRSRLGRLRRRIGRRGAVLLLFSAAFLLIGLKAYTDPAPDGGRLLIYALLPDYVRALLWGIPALVGIASALTGRRGDGVGFAVLSVPTVLVSVSYLWSFVGFLVGATSYAYGWVSATSWLLITSVLLIVAGWPEAPDRTRRHVETVLIEEPEDDE